MTNFDLDCPTDGCEIGCEIVIPIVVKISFYVEPVVLEQPPNCDVSQLSNYNESPAVAMSKTAEPSVSEAALKQSQTEKQPQTQLNLMPIKSGRFHWLQALLSYCFPGDWNSIHRPVS